MSDDKPKTSLPARRPNRDDHGHFLPGHKLGGHPVKLSDDLIERLASQIAAGKSIEEACAADPELPVAGTIYHWLGASDRTQNHEEIAARLRQCVDLAREQHADRLAQEYEEEARAGLRKPNKDHAQELKAFGDMVRWKTAMLSPSRYGRRVGDAGDIALNVGVQVVLPGKDDEK